MCKMDIPNNIYEDIELDPIHYKSQMYEIVSKVAFLIGVKEHLFNDDQTHFDKNLYNEWIQNTNTRVVRNLCLVRSFLFMKYKAINNAIIYDMKNINVLDEYFHCDIVESLRKDGIELSHANWKINQYITDVCDKISYHINDCRSLFPIWINWEYIKELFIIPKIHDDRQIKSVWGYYVNNINNFPFKLFINVRGEFGKMLLNDYKFITMLYGLHGEKFKDISKLKDASEEKKSSIYDFLEYGSSAAIVVDCENANIFKLYSVLQGLNHDYLRKIKKIILYNDSHTSSAWKLLNRFVDIKIEHNMVERIKENKSLVDMKLAVGTCREYYENHIESFILVSSDSDYWGLITEMPECRFLVAIEYDKASAAIVEAMKANNIAYCHIDDFCSNNLEQIETEALLLEIGNCLKDISFDINKILSQALFSTNIMYNENEREQFIKRYLSGIKLKEKDGLYTIEI